MPDWGPKHQQAPGRRRRRKGLRRELCSVAIAVTLIGGFLPNSIRTIAWVVVTLGVFGVIANVVWWLVDKFGSRQDRESALDPADALAGVREQALTAGGGVYLGAGQSGTMYFSRSQRAVLVLGPPRSGKTSSVIIPTLVAHTGPAVSTSTKPDVAAATAAARRTGGKVWLFDPTGKTSSAAESELRWSPVAGSRSWDDAVLMARAMTSDVGRGVSDSSHWSNRAQALLAPMLHAAAVHNRDMAAVVGWVLSHDLSEAGKLLEYEDCSEIAFKILVGIRNTEERERAGIFSAAADALQAYQSESALAVSRDANFDPAAFVRSQDTVYIHAPADAQAATAPLVCALLSEIRRATYQAHASDQLTHGQMLFALDEVANIAPLPELPQIASEGGSQGLTLLIALQDLSQARHRWGTQADGFLTLFGTKLILTGVADKTTLDAVSTMLGEYDRQMVSRSSPDRNVLGAMLNPHGASVAHNTTTHSTQRTPILSPGDIAKIPAGRALHLDGVTAEMMTLTPAFATEPWRTITTPSA